MKNDLLDEVISNYPTAITVGLAATALLIAVHAVASRGAPRQPEPAVPLLGRLAWLGTVAAVLVLGGTAFATVLSLGAMHGYPLLIHTAAGGAVSFALAVVAVTWARAMRRGSASRPGTLTRVSFWSVLLLGLIASVSMVTSTFPLFGTAGMERLLDIHRWSGLGLFVTTALLAYLLRVRRR